MSHASRPRSTSAFAALLAGLTLAVGACGGDDAATTPAKPKGVQPPKGQPAKVVKAIDGDTVDVEVAGQTQRVRLLGIDAPESTKKRTGSVECGGKMAASAMRALISRYPDGVDLATDPSQDAKDQYGRTLAYLTPRNGDPTWGEQLLAAGWAEVYEQTGKPILLDQQFSKAADSAKSAEAGIWLMCDGDFHKAK